MVRHSSFAMVLFGWRQLVGRPPPPVGGVLAGCRCNRRESRIQAARESKSEQAAGSDAGAFPFAKDQADAPLNMTNWPSTPQRRTLAAHLRLAGLKQRTATQMAPQSRRRNVGDEWRVLLV